jgi:hypothetical protein
MKTRNKLEIAVSKIMNAPDSDDVDDIMRVIMDDLIDVCIMNSELRLYLTHLDIELKNKITDAKDFIEINNIRKALLFTEQINRVFEIDSYKYELN